MPRKAAQDRTLNPTKNITVDAVLVDLINARADALEGTLGFRPTISQTLRYLLHAIPPGNVGTTTKGTNNADENGS